MASASAPVADAPVTLTPEMASNLVRVIDTSEEQAAQIAALTNTVTALQAAERGASGGTVRRTFQPGAGSADGGVPERYSRYSPATIQLANVLLDQLKGSALQSKVRAKLDRFATDDLQGAARAVSGTSRTLPGRRVRFNTSEEDGFGAELVQTCPTDEFWDGALCTSDIMGLFPEAPVKGGKIKYLTVSALPTAYTGQRAQDCEGLKCVPDTAIGTEYVEADAGKLKMKLCMPLELTEDSFLDVVQEYTEIGQRAIQIINEFVIVRGDTTLAGETNINNLNAAITVTGDNFTPDFTVLDGLAKATITDNVNNNGAEYDWWTAGDEITTNVIQKLRTLMFDEAMKQHWGFCADAADLAILVDYSTYAALTQLDDVKFCDKNCDTPTLQTGQLASIWGIPIIPSAAIPLADLTGQIDIDTPANNVYGQLHVVNVKGFKLGKAAELDIETIVNKDCDLVEIIFRWRLAFARHSSTGDAGGIEAVASIYGIAFAP